MRPHRTQYLGTLAAKHKPKGGRVRQAPRNAGYGVLVTRGRRRVRVGAGNGYGHLSESRATKRAKIVNNGTDRIRSRHQDI